MHLEPLRQWICDECHQPIEAPDRGHMEWIVDQRDRASGFRIVHQGRPWPGPQRGEPSPPPPDCRRYTNHSRRHDLDLTQFLGTDGLVEMLALLDPGSHHEPDFKGPHVRDVREFVEVIRRLHVPYYEEARLYWDRARRDGFFEDMNEVVIFLPFTLKALVEKYRREAA